MVDPVKSAAATAAPTTSPHATTTTQAVQRVLIPLRHFASEIGRSRQFVYGEMASGRLTTVLHGGRRFVHYLERDRYVAALLAASPRYGGGPASSPTRDASERATAG